MKIQGEINMNLGALQRFSLNHNNDDNSKLERNNFSKPNHKVILDPKTTVSEKAYIDLNDEGCPVFHLKDTIPSIKDVSHLTMYFICDMEEMQVYIPWSCRYEAGTENDFITTMKSINAIDSISDETKEYMRSIICLGHICEIFSKMQIPITKVKENIDLLNTFLIYSFEYYGNSPKEFKFNMSSVLNSLPIKKVKSDLYSRDPDFYIDNEYISRDAAKGNEFILPSISRKNVVSCIGILGIRPKYIYLRINRSEVYKFTYLSVLDFESNCSEGENLIYSPPFFHI